MDTIPGIAELRHRRKTLLLESELNRQALRLEVARIGQSVEQVRRGFSSGRSFWKLAAPVAGFLIARKFSKMGTVAKGSVVVGLVRSLWKSWRERRQAAR